MASSGIPSTGSSSGSFLIAKQNKDFENNLVVFDKDTANRWQVKVVVVRGGPTEAQGGAYAPPLAGKSSGGCGICPSALPWKCPQSA
ncbi:hypothetical protein L3X38_043154 [Prunus dulcis]|uniref:Uncharacterized protein n=1 Tax=Prunus dulcis TaxID=3755 RepID=A0AAD4UX91_PRUDU|nr:hypothetical protein L3X38_043154 [Prunus dulcis]